MDRCTESYSKLRGIRDDNQVTLSGYQDGDQMVLTGIQDGVGLKGSGSKWPSWIEISATWRLGGTEGGGQAG
jgi:hypothetical protein